MAKKSSKPQMPDIVKLIDELRQRMHTTVEAVYDPTRIYEYGVAIRLGALESNTRTINEMRDWCNKTYGPKPYGEYYGDRWMVSNNTFWFKHEKDRTMFLMRWS